MQRKYRSSNTCFLLRLTIRTFPKFNCKEMISRSLSVFVFIFLFRSAYAQFPPNVTTRTPYGNLHVPVPGPGYFMRPMNYGRGKATKYTFRVVMKNDSAFNSRTRIDYSSGPHTLTVKDRNKEKIKISPADT